MDQFQSILIDMRVNLRRRDIAVTQQFLNNSQIRPATEQEKALISGPTIPVRPGAQVLAGSAASTTQEA